jgi:hypothetical protein
VAPRVGGGKKKKLDIMPIVVTLSPAPSKVEQIITLQQILPVIIRQQLCCTVSLQSKFLNEERIVALFS